MKCNLTLCGDTSVLQICKQKNYRWVKEAETQVRSVIRYYSDELLKEAIGCNCVDILDEKRMYEKFCTNRDNEEEYANKYICKFFAVKLFIKALFWTLGEWKFTAQDREMLEYFYKNHTGNGLNRKAFAFKFANHLEMTDPLSITKKLHTNYEAYGCFSDVAIKFLNKQIIYNFDPFTDLRDIATYIMCAINGLHCNYEACVKAECETVVDLIFSWKSLRANTFIVEEFDDTHTHSILSKIKSVFVKK